MVRDVQIVQVRRDGGISPQDRLPAFMQVCMWCDNPHHLRREYEDWSVKTSKRPYNGTLSTFGKSWVYSTKTSHPLRLNQGREGMTRLMEEVEAWHVEVVHYWHR